MLLEICHTITVRLEFIRILKYFGLSQLVRNILRSLVLCLIYLILKLCYLDRVINIGILITLSFQLG